MDHGAVIRRRRRHVRSTTTLFMTCALLALPSAATAAEAVPAQPASPAPVAAGAKLVEPADGHHFDHLEVAPMVQFDPSTGPTGKTEVPKWVLVATDPEMKTTVRYCRQFVWASANGAFHWGCNRWATGADQFGNDQLQPLEAGKVYYWQVVSKDEAGTGEVKSAVRAFAIDAEKTGNDIKDISAQINGTVFDDGTQLNLGAAALVNSGVRVSSINSTKLAPVAFRIRVRHIGAVDYSRSYVKISSAAGTRYLKLNNSEKLGVNALWRLTAAERRLKTKRFTYQAFLKSRKNGSLVRSQHRVVLIRATKKPKPPKWTPDRKRVGSQL